MDPSLLRLQKHLNLVDIFFVGGSSSLFGVTGKPWFRSCRCYEPETDASPWDLPSRPGTEEAGDEWLDRTSFEEPGGEGRRSKYQGSLADRFNIGDRERRRSLGATGLRILWISNGLMNLDPGFLDFTHTGYSLYIQVWRSSGWRSGLKGRKPCLQRG